MPGPSCQIQARVRYAETDGQRVAHHSVYLIWFELGRAALLRERGLDYNALEDRGFYFVVIEAQAKYLAPARYDDLISIRTSLEALRSREMTVSYEITLGERILAKGWTRLAMLDRAGRPVSFPEDVRRALGDSEPPVRGDALISPLA